MKLVSLTISSLVLSLVACGGSSKSHVNSKDFMEPETAKVQRAKPSKHHQLSIRFQNERGEIVIELDPDAEDLYLEFHGGKMPSKYSDTISSKEDASKIKSKPEAKAAENDGFLNALDSVFSGESSAEKIESEEGIADLEGIAKEDTQAIVELLGDAQTAFYAKDFERANDLLNQSLKIVPTARAYAMLGSMGLVQGNRLAAREYWKKSLELDDSQQSVKKALANLEKK
jgi:tetratricopeptide (TPR) repeat protein